jgi:ParB family chromosome partitioning protein
MAEEKDTEEQDPKKRGLGRGLDALFDDNEEGGLGSGSTRRFVLGVDQLEPNPSQPRQEFKEQHINELAESISTHGLLQPILVRPVEGSDDKYQIIAGERRWRASQVAQLHEVPVIIKNLDDSETLQIALIENLQREDLNPLEEASSYRNLVERFGFSQERLAAVIGKSRSHIANTIRLLSLPDKVQTYVWEGKLSAGHGRALLGAKDPEALAKEVIAKGLNVRETEKLAAEFSAKPRKEKASKGKDPDTIALEEEVANALGMRVNIDMKGEGGSLKVTFESLDQLDDILHRLSHYPGAKKEAKG